MGFNSGFKVLMPLLKVLLFDSLRRIICSFCHIYYRMSFVMCIFNAHYPVESVNLHTITLHFKTLRHVWKILIKLGDM